MTRTDLHTHSQASPDGSLRLADYRTALDSGKLDCIAITDHDRIDFALKAKSELGEGIIVGEEITTLDGEIIGLYLTEAISPGLSAKETAAQIHKQGGLVYIPHPFETVRKGITLEKLDAITKDVDIVEIYNGRSLQNRGSSAEEWIVERYKAGASSSDSHGKLGWTRTYSQLAEMPTRETLIGLLNEATYRTNSTGVIGRLYPKFNRLRGKL